MALNGRALHYVFKIGERKSTMQFFREVLGMKVLRHEEFADGCEAACNGPYANRWSKTMVGYGPEDNNFVIELTYNYPIKSYERGNDFIGITIKSSEALQRAKSLNWPILSGNILECPGGYKFFIKDEPQPSDKDPVEKVTLASSDLNKSIEYWNGLLGLQIFEKSDDSVILGYKENEAKLELKTIDSPINRAKAYGRIAFSIPYGEQEILDQKIKAANQTILTPLINLETPGKSDVRVIILADPDGHEICFVDDENFRKLSQVDPDGEPLLNRWIKKDEP